MPTEHALPAGDGGDIHLHDDIACANCGYNLRGMPRHAACPECGIAIDFTVALVAGTSKAKIDRFDAHQKAAGICGADARACELVDKALRQAILAGIATNRNQQVEILRISSVDARALCDAVADLAEEATRSDSEAAAYLASLGIHCSQDVGRIVSALIAVGRIDGEGEDVNGLFQGIFTLDTLFRARRG